MAAKSKQDAVFFCNNCGYESKKWMGQCPSCKAWGAFSEEPVIKNVSSSGAGSARRSYEQIKPVSINEINADEDERIDTGFEEFQRVLGGGIVPGSLVLIGGDPGIGKSTLLLQAAGNVAASGRSVIYISGEESLRQIKLRADRIGRLSDNLKFVSDTDIDRITDMLGQEHPDLCIIDSIQTMCIRDLSSSAGSITQVRECTNMFMRTAKSEEIPIFIVGHVNKDGAIAGPKVMEHIVDAVLFFEGERNLSYRILRAVKNRYGSTNEIGVFEMLDKGLEEVENASAMLLSGRPLNVSGNCVACVMEGSRPVLTEVQALVTKSGFPSPRRMCTGFDYNRMCIILAVLEKRAGLFFGTLDVYVNIVGGLRLEEPAADLPVALALYSGLMDRPINDKLTAMGEIGLGGEIRAVGQVAKRLKEVERMGFEKCIIPKQALRGLDLADYSIEVIPVSNVKQAFDAINK